MENFDSELEQKMDESLLTLTASAFLFFDDISDFVISNQEYNTLHLAFDFRTGDADDSFASSNISIMRFHNEEESQLARQLIVKILSLITKYDGSLFITLEEQDKLLTLGYMGERGRLLAYPKELMEKMFKEDGSFSEKEILTTYTADKKKKRQLLKKLIEAKMAQKEIHDAE